MGGEEQAGTVSNRLPEKRTFPAALLFPPGSREFRELG